MKCVKGRCGYYISHNYKKDYKVCGLEGSEFYEDSDKECNIDKIIDEKNNHIELLKRMRSGILKLQ